MLAAKQYNYFLQKRLKQVVQEIALLNLTTCPIAWCCHLANLMAWICRNCCLVCKFHNGNSPCRHGNKHRNMMQYMQTHKMSDLCVSLDTTKRQLYNKSH